MTAVWAQFITYDISLTPQMTGFNSERLKCCGVDFSDFHPECFPIRLPDGDPVHGPAHARCQDYTRSATAPRAGCTLGPREQMNDVSSYLDASTIYGNSQPESDELREFSGGRLLVQSSQSGNTLLPPNVDSTDCRPDPLLRCFKSGDKRSNENLGLAALQTIWVREHNRIAKELAKLNPHWVDEIVFQETRRIVIAQLQHITYKEYLPLILGKEAMETFDLRLEKNGYFKEYDMSQNPGIANSVAVAALYFFVSLMPKRLQLFDELGNGVGEEVIGASFYAPFTLYKKDGLDTVLRSLLRSLAQTNDRHINSVFTDHMFQQSNTGGRGLDLAAQLIQQSRDHGIPPYVHWIEFCDLGRVKEFKDLLTFMSKEAVDDLHSVYLNVTDIDLLPGLLAERPFIGSTVGPTMRCLLGKQFHSLRKSDRHWYETDMPPSVFKRQQLNSIRRSTSLARIICENSDKITSIQPNPFVAADPFLNSFMLCKGGFYKPLDLTPWQDLKPHIIVNSTLVKEAIVEAHREISKVYQQERDLARYNRLADPQSPVGTAFGFNRPKRQSAKIANTSIVLEYASVAMVRDMLKGEFQDLESNDVRELLSALPSVDLSQLNVEPVLECDELALPCDHTTKYRTLTGWCNNLEHPSHGKSFQPFIRLLPPVYEDGIGAPRAKSVVGKPLPSPRLISTHVHTDVSRLHTHYSLMVMQLAQITDHDLTFTPVIKGFINEGILNCLSCDSMRTVHPQCFPIPVPEGDPFFPHINYTTGEPFCIPATRSMPGQRTLGPREQINQLTAYLDMSFVYGSEPCDAKELRSNSGGKLNVTNHPVPNRKPLMPQIVAHPECRSPSKVCFRAGDARASEQPALGSLHTVFLREHNRIAEDLAVINSNWNDDKLYFETRRIMGAAFQHIIFSEFLPRLFGWDGVRSHGLTLQNEGYYNDYTELCDGTVLNEFSAAAFRFGHSLLRPFLRRVDAMYRPLEPSVQLRDHFFNPEILYRPGIIDELVLGLVDTPMETLDQFITEEVTNHLFEKKNVPFSGMDLISLNMQRARDHGIRGYNFYRKICNLTMARDFKDLSKEISAQQIQALASVYAHVDDIDLFPGGMSETSLPGGVLGPTFACIVGNQFRRVRSCDRFWYENGDALIRFTPPQLAEIRKITLSRVICNNLDQVISIQRAALDLQDPFMNPRVPCDTIPNIDLTLWREQTSCTVNNMKIDTGATKHMSPCVTCTCTKEGAICQSLKVPDCFRLADSFSAEAVLNDTVCKVQCAFAFRALQEIADTTTANVLGFS